MSEESRVVRPGKAARHVIGEKGESLVAPRGWALLPPGDAALTRRVKKAGPHWQVQEKKGRKLFSRGVWAPAETIRSLRVILETERETPAYKKKRAADKARREKEQGAYVEDFNGAVLAYLKFHPCHQGLAEELATAVTELASPVGSGTVARTRRIPLEERAEAAVIAWMRHQTTAYDSLRIARVKGERRRVRRRLAKESVALLQGYRRGEPMVDCPLKRALAKNR
ncbi:DUF2293 domain-containing protein [Desulfoluna spongiiphila]|uniref:Uncharacterized conserved protein n=1 Tax=Desulfoluna spongiiphila TaxID=419481 RepID=A0A1G5H3B4_9BACT|nr:DUF2293 domain-containing protein [Desulfoluna spongiiphila]SCY58372.1 Uncharacterized conserved protein [Desulfoluna spongiiphila]